MLLGFRSRHNAQLNPRDGHLSDIVKLNNDVATVCAGNL